MSADTKMSSDLAVDLGDDLISQELGGHVQLDEEASQIGPLFQLRNFLQQPVQDRVHHRLTARHQTLPKTTPGKHRQVEFWHGDKKTKMSLLTFTLMCLEVTLTTEKWIPITIIN